MSYVWKTVAQNENLRCDDKRAVGMDAQADLHSALYLKNSSRLPMKHLATGWCESPAQWWAADSRGLDGAGAQAPYTGKIVAIS